MRLGVEAELNNVFICEPLQLMLRKGIFSVEVRQTIYTLLCAETSAKCFHVMKKGISVIQACSWLTFMALYNCCSEVVVFPDVIVPIINSFSCIIATIISIDSGYLYL